MLNVSRDRVNNDIKRESKGLILLDREQEIASVPSGEVLLVVLTEV